MILLPCSKTLAVGSVVAVAAGTTALLVVGCCLAVTWAAAALFNRRPRLPLRIPRFRGLEEMMSNMRKTRLEEWGATIERLVESAHSCKCGYETLMSGKVRKEGGEKEKVAGGADSTHKIGLGEKTMKETPPQRISLFRSTTKHGGDARASLHFTNRVGLEHST